MPQDIGQLSIMVFERGDTTEKVPQFNFKKKHENFPSKTEPGGHQDNDGHPSLDDFVFSYG